MSINDTGKAQSQRGAQAQAALAKIITAWTKWKELADLPPGMSTISTDAARRIASEEYSKALTEGKKLLEGKGK